MPFDIPPGLTDGQHAAVDAAVTILTSIRGRPGIIAQLTDDQWEAYQAAKRVYFAAWEDYEDRSRAAYHRAVDTRTQLSQRLI